MRIYVERRNELLNKMLKLGGGVAVIHSGSEAIRNNDVEYSFRHNSNFHYLTGLSEPDLVLVLVAREKPYSILFCKESSIDSEIWHGKRPSHDEIKNTCAFEEVAPISALRDALLKLFDSSHAVFAELWKKSSLVVQLNEWISELRKFDRSGARVPKSFVDVNMLIEDMRLIKSRGEIEKMRRAAGISVQAHLELMRNVKIGMTERQLEGQLLASFYKAGASAPAYPSIIASGPNACVLHHNPSNRIVKDSELILVDAGCEYESYASDITRTFPSSGKFSPEQRQIYSIVLAAQLAAIKEAYAGNDWMQPHHIAVRIITEGLFEVGLLNTNTVGTVEDAIASQAYAQFFMSKTSHWIGMDVHDVGSYLTPDSRSWRVLEEGITLTIEPGIYIRPAENVPEKYWNIGIRIEDDVLITRTGNEILGTGLPKEIFDIENIMA